MTFFIMNYLVISNMDFKYEHIYINMNAYRDTEAIRARVQSLLKQCEI